MKILTILGSSKYGNTAEIIKVFKAELNSIGNYEFEDLFLEDHKIDFCIGCHNCIVIGEDKCPHNQMVKIIEDKILTSDAIILATPGYMFSVTGIMKNFLDHVAYNCHRPKYFGKKIFFASSCTKRQKDTVFTPMRTWGSASGFQYAGSMYVDMLPLPFTEKEMTKRRKKIKEGAVSFDKILKKKESIKPSFGEIVVFHIFRTLCRLAPKILKADYRYFIEKNAYQKETKWFVTAKISPLAHFLANFIEKRVEKSVLKMIDSGKLENINGCFGTSFDYFE